MRLAIRLCIVASAFVSSSDCEAGGFFRRVPEVGEWARYSQSWESTFLWDADNLETISADGECIIKCVGEEERDGQRHLWLELRSDLTHPTGHESWAVMKVLIPEDQVVGGDFAEYAVEVWVVDSSSEAVELDPQAADVSGQVRYLTGMQCFPFAAESEIRGGERTLTLDGVELTLSECEAGALAEYQLDTQSRIRQTIGGDVTWWVSDDHAFGVVAADLTTRFRTGPPGDAFWENVTRFDLIATGTDAVSELPDHN